MITLRRFTDPWWTAGTLSGCLLVFLLGASFLAVVIGFVISIVIGGYVGKPTRSNN